MLYSLVVYVAALVPLAPGSVGTSTTPHLTASECQQAAAAAGDGYPGITVQAICRPEK